MQIFKEKVREGHSFYLGGIFFLFLFSVFLFFRNKTVHAADFIIEGNVLTGYEGSNTSITIPSNVTVIGDEVFEDNETLVNISIPANITEIGNLAFAGCSNLEHVELSQGLQIIGNGAFQDCVKIKEMTIPDSVTELGAWAFLGCSSLQSVSVPAGIVELQDSVFQDCTSLESVKIPENIKIISDWAFWGCVSLKEAELPKALEEIGEGAFQDCAALKEIILYDKVSKIGDLAFENCTSLEKVVVYAENIEMGRSVFGGCKSTLKFYGNINSSVIAEIRQQGFPCSDLSEYVSSENQDQNENTFGNTVTTKTVITVKQKKITMTKGKKAKIQAASSDNMPISYKSLKKRIVTVNKKGVLKAVRTGRAVIEVSSGGTKVNVKVIVKRAGTNNGNTIVLSRELKISKSKINVKKGTKITIDSDAVVGKVTFRSLNKKIVTVSVKGVVKARKKGKTAIVIKSGKKTKKLSIIVK